MAIVLGRQRTTTHGLALGNRWRDFDPYMLITTIVLMGFGAVAIWSADGQGPLVMANLGVRQAVYGTIGLVIMVLVANFDYRFLASFAWVIYLGALVLLALVLTPQLGVAISGAQRWFVIGGVSVQPSEFGKIATIIALAAFVSSRGTAMRELGNVVISIFIVAVPMFLIYREPDLGTTLVYGVIWASMMLVARTRRLYFVIMLLMAGPAALFAWNFILLDYMKQRLLLLLNPSADPLGQGYQIQQALISIGAGGWFGDGLAGGTQSQLNLLGVRETDFIFAHATSMFGFFGMLALFASFIIFLWRCLRVVETARDSFGQCLAVGITGVIFFQAVVNIGMNVGLLPVTGITLPFVSAGLSSLWTFLIALGIMQSILMRRRKLAFQPD